jgi:CheY-like chemotaxis protein
MESGRSPVNLRRCSLYDLAREAVEMMSALAEAAQIRLELNSYAAHDSIYFDADPDRILQVVTNLLSNAIKFSPEGSTVSVEIDANADALSLKVIDRGRGIPADKLECIFDRFQQVESTDSSKKGGTGLGTGDPPQHHSAARRTDLGAAERKLGAAEPWQQRHHVLRSIHAVGADWRQRVALGGDTRGGTRRGLILVCDDDPGIRTVVCEQLQRRGYDVIEAAAAKR